MASTSTSAIPRTPESAQGSDLFETGSERRVREFDDLIRRGYKPENAMRISGLTPEDIDKEF